jgi:hypothetical protein
LWNPRPLEYAEHIRDRAAAISAIVHRPIAADWRSAAWNFRPRAVAAPFEMLVGSQFPARRRHQGMESCVSETLHPSAPHDLPGFITAPGDTDILMVVVGIVLIAAVLGVGNLYLHLHTLPERMAHRSQKLQFEIVAVLGLLALFTHNHLF